MENGFVLFLDVLGFSKLVLNNSPDEIRQIYSSEITRTAQAASLFSMLSTGSPQDFSLEVLSSSQGELHDVLQDKLKFHMMSDSLVAWTSDVSPESLKIIGGFAAWYMALTLKLGLPHRGGISTGNVQLIDLPLNGRLQSNVVGSGVVNAHGLEGGQEWMGCIVAQQCFEGFHDTVKQSLINVSGGVFATYAVPYKTKECDAIVVDWRTPLKKLGAHPEKSFFHDQFSRYNKPPEGTEAKVQNTQKFFEAAFSK